MTAHLVDPIADPRWSSLIARDSRATLFHSPGWLMALRQTYDYEPMVLTSSSPSQSLTDGIVFCRIKSWFTGKRLVSLPFSDHCEPLIGAGEDSRDLVNIDGFDQFRYIELRPIQASPTVQRARGGFQEADAFWLHRLDLSPSEEKIFHGFHPDCVRRKIRKAERESLEYSEGNTPELLGNFYRLLLRTRQRHHLPPQPKTWFRNLSKFLGESIKIRVASKNGRPIASILTFSYNNKLMYKYGCSDERYHKYGGMQLLLWRAIQDAKGKNYSEFDLGRCALDNDGLRMFKDRWGATRSKLTYWRCRSTGFSADRQLKIAQQLFRICPASFLQVAGRTLYRHIG